MDVQIPVEIIKIVNDWYYGIIPAEESNRAMHEIRKILIREGVIERTEHDSFASVIKEAVTEALSEKNISCDNCGWRGEIEELVLNPKNDPNSKYICPECFSTEVYNEDDFEDLEPTEEAPIYDLENMRENQIDDYLESKSFKKLVGQFLDPDEYTPETAFRKIQCPHCFKFNPRVKLDWDEYNCDFCGETFNTWEAYEAMKEAEKEAERREEDTAMERYYEEKYGE